MAYRKVQYRMYEIIDAKNQTQDDFSIFVENIPILNFPTNLPKDKENLEFNYDHDLETLFTEEISNWLNTIIEDIQN